MRNAFIWSWNKGLKSTTQGKILICAECCSRFNPTPHDPCSAVTCRQMSRRSPWYHHLISPLGVCFWGLSWLSSLQWTGLMIPEKQAGLLGGFGLFRKNSGPSSLQLVDCPTQLSVFSMAKLREHNRKICYFTTGQSKLTTLIFSIYLVYTYNYKVGVVIVFCECNMRQAV